jgi:hypothetical protein
MLDFHPCKRSAKFIRHGFDCRVRCDCGNIPARAPKVHSLVRGRRRDRAQRPRLARATPWKQAASVQMGISRRQGRVRRNGRSRIDPRAQGGTQLRCMRAPPAAAFHSRLRPVDDRDDSVHVSSGSRGFAHSSFPPTILPPPTCRSSPRCQNIFSDFKAQRIQPPIDFFVH